VYATVSPDLATNKKFLFFPKGLTSSLASPVEAVKGVDDDATRERLWQESERMVAGFL